MSDCLIPEMTFSEFKKLKANEIAELKSFIVTVNCEYAFTVIVPRTDYVKVQTEYLGQLSNAIGGKDPSEIKPVEV